MLRTKSTKELTAYEKRLREYYWKCFISEFSKVLIFLIIFALLNLTKEYIVALFFLMILRNNGGGLHCKHYLSCLMVSFVFLVGSIILALLIVPAPAFILISLLICLPIVYYLVPITSDNRPPATSEQVKKSKRNTSIILILFILLICICPNTIYLNIGYWTVILHIFQLIIARQLRR